MKLGKQSIKAFSLLTALLFVFQSIVPAGLVFAAPEVSSFSGQTTVDSARSALFSLPAEFGKVLEYHNPGTAAKDSPFIIHVQDAHSNPEAQENIKNIMGWISEEKTMGLGADKFIVALEGAIGELHPEYLDFFKDHAEAGAKVVSHLRDLGELNGSDLFAWNLYRKGQFNPKFFQGVEDAGLYRQNISTYRDLLENQSVIENQLKELRSLLDKASSRGLSKEVRSFLRERRQRKLGDYGTGQNAPQWNTYLSFLSKEASEKLQIDLKNPFEQVRFPSIVRVLALGDIAKAINRPKAESEKTAFFKSLRTKNLTAAENADLDLFEKLPATNELRALAEKVWTLAEKQNLHPENDSEFWHTVGERILASEVDAVGMAAEMKTLETWLLNAMIPSDDERRLVQMDSDFGLLEKLLTLKITRSDFADFLAARPGIESGILGKGLESFLGSASAPVAERSGSSLVGAIHELPLPIVAAVTSSATNAKAGIQKFIEKAVSFYSLAGERDNALLANTLKAAAGKKAALLISGGFHSEGLIELIKAKGLGYAVIQPKITHMDNGTLYRRAMLDQNSDVSAYFDQPYLTAQEGLFLKELLEISAPAFAAEASLPTDALSQKVAEVINRHPVLSGRIQASAKNENGTTGLRVDLKARSAEPAQSEPVNFAGATIPKADLLVNPFSSAALQPPLLTAPSTNFALVEPVLNNAPGLLFGIKPIAGVTHFDRAALYAGAVRPVLATAKSEMRVTQAEIDKGAQYFQGKIATDPVKTRFRASRVSDFKVIPQLTPEERLHYMQIALASLARGEGTFSTAAAGAAARMNMKELLKPENRTKYADLLVMADEIFGTGHEIKSKAAVPIGRDHDGNPLTFLGLLLTNIARLQERIAALEPQSQVRDNRVLIMTNADYQSELDLELANRSSYGVASSQFIRHDGQTGFQQSLGAKYYANAADVRKVYDKLIAAAQAESQAQTVIDELNQKYQVALLEAERVRAAIDAGNLEAVVYPNLNQPEQDPLGHGEFFHQIISKGIILDLIGDDFDNPLTRWISFRNIDNSAATYDEDWLISLGIFLEENLDMQAEVSLRIPGQKGGGLIIAENKNNQLTEDPSFEATLKAMLAELKAQGFERVPLTADIKESLRQQLLSQGELILEASRMDFEGTKITSAEALEAFLVGEKEAEQRIAVFKHPVTGQHLFRIVRSQDTDGFNDAVALLTPGYILDLYRAPNQSRRELYEELKAAKAAGDFAKLESIAERGRSRFPSLVDPKPARDNSGNVTVKIETNMWQSTGIVGDETHVGAVGVYGVANVQEDFARADTPEKEELARSLRMLATKSWNDKVESYASNQPYIAPLIKMVTEGDLFPDAALLAAQPTKALAELAQVVLPGQLADQLTQVRTALTAGDFATAMTGLAGILRGVAATRSQVPIDESVVPHLEEAARQLSLLVRSEMRAPAWPIVVADPANISGALRFDAKTNLPLEMAFILKKPADPDEGEAAEDIVYTLTIDAASQAELSQPRLPSELNYTLKARAGTAAVSELAIALNADSTVNYIRTGGKENALTQPVQTWFATAFKTTALTKDSIQPGAVVRAEMRRERSPGTIGDLPEARSEMRAQEMTAAILNKILTQAARLAVVTDESRSLPEIPAAERMQVEQWFRSTSQAVLDGSKPIDPKAWAWQVLPDTGDLAPTLLAFFNLAIRDDLVSSAINNPSRSEMRIEPVQKPLSTDLAAREFLDAAPAVELPGAARRIAAIAANILPSPETISAAFGITREQALGTIAHAAVIDALSAGVGAEAVSSIARKYLDSKDFQVLFAQNGPFYNIRDAINASDLENENTLIAFAVFLAMRQGRDNLRFYVEQDARAKADFAPEITRAKLQNVLERLQLSPALANPEHIQFVARADIASVPRDFVNSLKGPASRLAAALLSDNTDDLDVPFAKGRLLFNSRGVLSGTRLFLTPALLGAEDLDQATIIQLGLAASRLGGADALTAKVAAMIAELKATMKSA